MTDAELQTAYEESVLLDALYKSADEHDRRTGAYDMPEEYEDEMELFIKAALNRGKP